jgi:DNA phosphorothioation-dependent restriction protein DptG
MNDSPLSAEDLLEHGHDLPEILTAKLEDTSLELAYVRDELKKSNAEVKYLNKKITELFYDKDTKILCSTLAFVMSLIIGVVGFTGALYCMKTAFVFLESAPTPFDVRK